jgi:hypothetical protein
MFFWSGHLVCTNCIQRYVSEQFDGNGSTDFECIGSAECSCKYSQAFLGGVLTPKLRKRVDEAVFRQEVSKAIEKDKGLWKCPKCSHIGYTDKKYPWVQCPECKVNYCTSCNEEDHGKQTCEEARREKLVQRDPKHHAHEVMSRACKRSCPNPNCNQLFIKSDGCNKMTCNKCKTLSCYLCGSEIKSNPDDPYSAYNHFCDCNGKRIDQVCASEGCANRGKFKLFTSTEDMEDIDRKKRQEAGRKALLERGISDEEQIRSILQSPDKESKRASNAKQQRQRLDPAPLAAAVPPQFFTPPREVPANFRAAAAADERYEGRHRRHRELEVARAPIDAPDLHIHRAVGMSVDGVIILAVAAKLLFP